MNAQNMVEGLKTDIGQYMATVDGTNGKVFTVRGLPFAIVRNGSAWDLLGPVQLEEAIEAALLPDRIREQCDTVHAENTGWAYEPLTWEGRGSGTD